PGSFLTLQESPHCQLRNCEFLTTKGFLLGWSVPAGNARLVMDNCVHAGNEGYLEFGSAVQMPRGISIVATRNTRIADHGLFMLGLAWPLDQEPLNDDEGPIRIDTAANLFDVGASLFELLQ